MDKLKDVKKCIVHADCPDGVMSALLLRDVLPWAEIEFVQYGTKAHKALRPEPGVLYADLSPPVRTRAFHNSYIVEPLDDDLLREYIDAGTIIIDHHPTAEPVVRAMGESGVFDSSSSVCGATLVFDYLWRTSRAAADLDIDEFEKVMDLVRLAGIRDTWRRSSPRWREACAQAAVLMFYPWDRWPDLRYVARLWDTRYSEFGEVLLTKREQKVVDATDNAFRFTSKKGTRVAVCEDPELSSDVAELIGDCADLVVAFGYTAEKAMDWAKNEAAPGSQMTKMRLSTRSRTGFDCAAFAKAYGGGGHRAAAGFSVDVWPIEPRSSDPYSTIVRLVADFEKREVDDGTEATDAD